MCKGLEAIGVCWAGKLGAARGLGGMWRESRRYPMPGGGPCPLGHGVREGGLWLAFQVPISGSAWP